MPGNIEAMVNQYKKIAVLKISENFNVQSSGVSKYIKKINCNFEIKRFLIFYKHRDNNYGVSVAMDSEDFKNYTSAAELGSYKGPLSKLYVQNKNEVVWETKNGGSLYYYKIEKIIALS